MTDPSQSHEFSVISAVTGRVVHAVCFHVGISLHLAGSGEIRLSTGFTLAAGNTTTHIDPADAQTASTAILRVLFSLVDEAAVDADGTLAVRFADGTQLRCVAHPDYEAWEVRDEDHLLVAPVQ